MGDNGPARTRVLDQGDERLHERRFRYGRAARVPWPGLEGFAAYAAVAKAVHNYGGPLFIVGVVIEVITWMRFNTFRS